MTRKTALFGALALVMLLAGCGSDKTPNPVFTVVKGSVGQLLPSRKTDTPSGPVVTRASLSKFNTPMIMAEIPTRGFYNFVVPYGVNGDVETWASSDDKTIAFRQGMVVATRGFGPDIMQSSGPGIAQVASGAGTYDRVYYYVDGADQTLRRDFRCTLSNLGSDTVTVVDQQHTTRHIAESCTGKAGDFTNEYWFGNGLFLRKSKQLLTLEWGPLVLSRVIDKG
jgi:hypothetical protein